jgi:tetratricopeptide (TPR) repeat protein
MDGWEKKTMAFLRTVIDEESGTVDLAFQSTMLDKLPLPPKRTDFTPESPALQSSELHQIIANYAFALFSLPNNPSLVSGQWGHIETPAFVNHQLKTWKRPSTRSEWSNLSLSYYLLSLKLGGPAYDPLLKIAFILRSQGHVRHAAFFLDMATKSFPDRPHGYRFLGDILNNIKRFDDALSMYKRALTLSGGRDADILLAMGDASGNMSKHKDAAKYYKQAHKYRPAAESTVGVFHSYRDTCDLQGQAKIVPMLSKYVTPAPGWNTRLDEPSALPPYSTLYLDSHPVILQHIARSWARANVKQARGGANPFRYVCWYQILCFSVSITILSTCFHILPLFVSYSCSYPLAATV